MTDHTAPAGAQPAPTDWDEIRKLPDDAMVVVSAHWYKRFAAPPPVAAPTAQPKALDDPRLQGLFSDAITGALAFGAQNTNPPPPGHWLEHFWNMARAERAQYEAAPTAAVQTQFLQLPPLTEVMYDACRGNEYEFTAGGPETITGYLDDSMLDEIWEQINTALRCAQVVAAAQTQRQEDASEALPFGIIDPDYARVFTMARVLAWQEGYSCCMQGSFTRDLDLLFVPWTDTARRADGDILVARIADATGLRVNGPPSDKPHGRKAWTLLFPGFGDPRFVDVSVMPTAASPPPQPPQRQEDAK